MRLRFIFASDINVFKCHTVVSYSNESVSFKLSPLGPKGNPLLAPAPWKKNITEGPPQTLGVLIVLLVAVQLAGVHGIS